MGKCRVEHVDKLGFIHWGHDDKTRDRAEIRDVEDTVVGGTVVTDQAATVDRKDHRQLLNCDVVDDWVKRSLKKRRVDRTDRSHSGDGHAAGKDHGMLFSDADVVGALGEMLLKVVEAGPFQHRGRDADDPPVALSLGDERLPEDLGVARGSARGPRGLAAFDDKRGDAVHGLAVGFGRCVTLTLDGLCMDEHRTTGLARPSKLTAECVDIVTVDRTEIGKPKRLEEVPRDEERLRCIFECVPESLHPGNTSEASFEFLPNAAELGVETNSLHEVRERADVLADAHSIVIQDDNDRETKRPGLVHAFVGHPTGQGTVADDGRHADALVATSPGRLGKAHGVGDRRAGVTSTHDVVLALGPPQESTHSLVLTKRLEPAQPAGEQLVTVGLVADVPEDLVARRVKLSVEGDGDLDRTEARPQVASGERHRVDDGQPHLGGKRFEGRAVHVAKGTRGVKRFEDRVLRCLAHPFILRPARRAPCREVALLKPQPREGIARQVH